MDKNLIRLEMKQKRARLTPEERDRAAGEVLKQLIPLIHQAKALFCYAANGTELPTDKIAAYAQSLGIPVAYPKVLPGRQMIFIVPERWAKGPFGILEPAAGEVRWPGPGDLMLLPGLAFTAAGGRLGYGGGYYDRYLARLAVCPLCCGVGYGFQLLPALPEEPHDRRLSRVVTN